MVTVRELAKILQDQPENVQDAQVILSIDGEGNGFKPLSEESWSVGLWDDEDGEVQHYVEDEATGLEMAPEDPDAFVLWPV